MSVPRLRCLVVFLGSFLLHLSGASAAVLLFADPDGTANWNSSEQAWTDAGTPSVWIASSSAEFSNGNAANVVTITQAINVDSIAQSGAGTQTGINGSGMTLTLSGGGANAVVANTSGADLTFGTGLIILQNPTTAGAAQRWNAASGSNIIVNSTLTGALTGGMWKEGAGVLQINAANSYSGSTYLKEGILQAGNAAAFGTSTIVFQGGTLRYGVAVTGGFASQFAALSGSAAILDTNGQNIILSNAITGAGGLIKRGAGILTTAAGSTYTGGTTVEAGMLRNGAGTGSNPFGAAGSMITVKSGATVDVNWTAAANYTTQYQITLEGRGLADTTNTMFGGFIGALTSSGTLDTTAQPFTHMIFTGDTTISGQLGGTSGRRFGLAPNMDARVRDSGGTVIPGQYHTLTIVNANTLSWRGTATTSVFMGDIKVEQGRLWSDGEYFGDAAFSLIINANTVNGSTVLGELGNWYSPKTITKKTVLNGGVIIATGTAGSSAGKTDYGVVTTLTLSGQMTLMANALGDNRLISDISMRDIKVTGQVTGTGGLRWTGSTAVLTDYDNTNYNLPGVTINRYSVLYLTNSANNFTGTVKLESGLLRLSDGTANGTLGSISNEVSFTTSANIAVLDLFGSSQGIGALNGSNSANHFVQNNRQNTTATLTVGNGGANGSFAGVLRDYAALPANNVAISNEGATNARLALVKTGAGQQILSGVSTFTGGTMVQQGALQIGSGATGQSTARLGNGAFAVNNGGRLEGNGIIGFAGATNSVNAGGILGVGTSTQTAVQYLTVEGGLTISGTLAMDLWDSISGSGTTAGADFLTFLTGSTFDLTDTAVLALTLKPSAGSSTTWAAGTWFQLFDFSNMTLAGRDISLVNASNWLLPTLDAGLFEWDLSRLETEGRIYVAAKAVTPTLEFDPADSFSGTAEWKDDTGYLAWHDTAVGGVALQEWANGANAVMKNGASNSLNVVEDVSASSISQSEAGTVTTINSSTASKLTLTGPNRVVSNTSGSALTFDSGLTVDITGTEKEWYATGGSSIVVNGVITGAVGSYSAGTVAGGFIKTGDGVLELRGANTYSGVTRLQGGAVLGVSAGAFGTSTVVFEGGTLRYGAAVTGGYASQFAPLNYGASARLDTNGFNVVLTTPLSGSGGVTKLGNGTLTLAAGSTYTGTTTVEQGILKNGATGAAQANAFGANNSQIIIKNGATLDLNWNTAATAAFGTGSKYNLTVEGKGVADATVAGGYMGAVTSSGSGSFTANPFTLITMSGATTFSGRAGSAAGRWGITAINANGYDITIVNANGLSWAVSTAANALNVRDIYIEQGLMYADGSVFGDDNYTIFIQASKTGATTFRGELRRYNGSMTITKKIALNGGIVGFESDAGTTSSVPRTLTLTGQVTLMDNNTIAANRFNSGLVNRDIKLTGKVTGTGGFEYQGITGTYSHTGTTPTERYSVMTLTNSASDFTGAVKLIRGVIRLSDGTSNGTLGAGGNEVNFTTAANISVLDLFGTNQSIGALTGASATNHFVQNNRTNTTATLTVGNGDAGGTFAGVLRDYGALPAGNASGSEATYTGDGAADAKLALTKTGAGMQVLTGVSTFTGGTIVNAGVLQVGAGATGQSTARLGSGGFTINNGGTLAGNGAVGAVGVLSFVNVGGTLAPGTTTQTASQRLDVYGGLTSTGALGFDLWGVTLGGGSAGNSNSLRFLSDEQITLGGALMVSNNTGTAATTWTDGTWFQLVDWNAVSAGNRSVDFTDISFLPTLAAGLNWDLTHFATEGRIYVVVPEPGRMLLLILGLAAAALRRRRAVRC